MNFSILKKGCQVFSPTDSLVFSHISYNLLLSCLHELSGCYVTQSLVHYKCAVIPRAC